MKVKRVEHVAVAVGDMTAGKRALSDVFGLDPSYEEHRHEFDVRMAMYELGGTQLELMQGPASTPLIGSWLARGDGLFHVCLEVEDLREAITELRDKGVSLLNDEPYPGHGGSQIVFIDPRATANVLFELVELPAAAAAV
jgi:methylmalonyl-CoA/ethylmalonyl-CoA epimerase